MRRFLLALNCSKRNSTYASITPTGREKVSRMKCQGKPRNHCSPLLVVVIVERTAHMRHAAPIRHTSVVACVTLKRDQTPAGGNKPSAKGAKVGGRHLANTSWMDGRH